ncbi:52 kDa repressor of the inhibitor of the protein kinase [Acipenser ruthenus]|uniref:52 kDa repressor of the inhibitor of the protein kinase n=1 Tax=Acipenser ruthenus TaxID=7906 RepID=A0A444TYY4_ACIRT|nr:52 kDa repressor of the inhibitor of the protein kinase [Acipenser ruthenus]
MRLSLIQFHAWLEAAIPSLGVEDLAILISAVNKIQNSTESLRSENRESIATLQGTLDSYGGRLQEPRKGWTAPFRCIFGKKPRVPDEFFDEAFYPTLRYSEAKDGVFCVACVIFSSGDIVLRSRPLVDWSNAKKIITIHLTTQTHLSAQIRDAEFLRVCDNKQQSIISSLNKAHQEYTEHSKSALRAIVDLIAVCGKQNVSNRGHTDERSNFRAFLEYCVKGDEALTRHLQQAPGNVKYCSHRVQKEIIDLYGKQISDGILLKCRNAKLFSLLADESSDISCTEQVPLILRYVDHSPSGQFSVREDFVAFISTSDTTGETLTTLFLNHLQQSNLNPSNLVGQGYDGAGNMSGKIRGVQACVREKYPSAAYLHCRNHSLNLTITHSTRIPLVRNTLNTVQEIVAFVTASPKRMQCFLDRIDTKQRLQKFSDTRWSQHDACLSTVIMNHENVFATIDHLKTDTSVVASLYP